VVNRLRDRGEPNRYRRWSAADIEKRNPYEPIRSSHRTLRDFEPSAYWWLPLAIGVGFTPVAIVLAMLSHGFGYINSFWINALFPLYRPLRRLEFGHIPLLFLSQYIVYGALVAFSKLRGRSHWAYAGAVLAFHFAAYAVFHWF
jgi:hypothetical protein